MTKDEQLALAREKAAEVNKGNQHSSKINRILNETLKRRLIQEEAKRAEAVVEALLKQAEGGEISAIKEVFDRMEGKAVARTEITGADGAELPVTIGISFVKPDSEVSE